MKSCTVNGMWVFFLFIQFIDGSQDKLGKYIRKKPDKKHFNGADLYRVKTTHNHEFSLCYTEPLGRKSRFVFWLLNYMFRYKIKIYLQLHRRVLVPYRHTGVRQRHSFLILRGATFTRTKKGTSCSCYHKHNNEFLFVDWIYFQLSLTDLVCSNSQYHQFNSCSFQNIYH